MTGRRVVKVAAGLLFVLAGLYVVIGEQLAGTSADAVVNAQVAVLRSPIDGDVRFELRTLGTRLAPDEVVATIRDQRVEDSRLVDLRRATAAALSELSRLEELAAVLQQAQDGYAKQAEAYAEGRIRQLEARIAETNAVIEAAGARLREADATLRRSSDLSRTGVQTVADLNRSRSAFEVAAQEVEGARNRLRYLSVEMAAAQRGVFLGDSYSDSPHSQQRATELAARIAELRTDIAERRRRVELLRAQENEERVRLARYTEARVAAPAPSILWELVAGPGEHVRRSQDIARVVDCTTTMVTASVRESLYNRLSVGDTAQFRLLGTDRVFQGTVARLAGSGAETIYRSLAIGPSAEHLKRFDVALLVPGLAAEPALACAVGRTGRVVFASRPLDFWRRLRAEIGLL